MENKIVYLLWHTRFASNDSDEDNYKLLGVYSLKEYAEEKV